MKRKKIIAAVILIGLSVGAGACVPHSSDGKVDQEILKRIEGEYGIPYDDDMDDDAYYDNECYWEMAVFTEADDFFTIDPPALMIYDAEAGDPGIAGTIVELGDNVLKIKINKDFSDSSNYPYDWTSEADTMKFTYKETEDGLELTNNEKTVAFVKYQEEN